MTQQMELLAKGVLLENLQNEVAILQQQVAILNATVMAKKNNSHKESRELLLHHLRQCKASFGMTPTFTRRELITAGVIPEMGSDTFRKCILKDDFEVHESSKGKTTTYRIKKGVKL